MQTDNETDAGTQTADAERQTHSEIDGSRDVTKVRMASAEMSEGGNEASR